MSKQITSIADVEDIAGVVDGLVRTNQALKALETAFEYTMNSKEQHVKTAFGGVVAQAITAIKDRDMDSTLDNLDEEGRTKLMKYVYKGMINAESGATLLKWHAKLVQRDGVGIICRALVDRRV